MNLSRTSGVGVSGRFLRSSLVVACVAAVAVLAFVLTSSASATGDTRFGTDRNAAAAQYHHPTLHHHGSVSRQAAEFVSRSTPSTQGGLPFTGENALEVAALGLLLAGGGLLIARRVRQQT